MNRKIAISFVFASTFLSAFASHSAKRDANLEELFDEWMKEFDKKYKSPDEKEKRMKIWIDNNGTYMNVI